MNSSIWRKCVLTAVSRTEDSWWWTLCVLSQLMQFWRAEIRKGESQPLTAHSPSCIIQFRLGKNKFRRKELLITWTYALRVCEVSLLLYETPHPLTPPTVSSMRVDGDSSAEGMGPVYPPSYWNLVPGQTGGLINNTVTTSTIKVKVCIPGSGKHTPLASKSLLHQLDAIISVIST